MNTKTTTIIVLTLIAIAVLAGLAVWNQLPEQMASHWNINNEVDGYISKFWGVFLMPLVTLGLFGLFSIVPNIDPHKANIEGFRESFNIFIIFFVSFLLYVHALTIAWSFGYNNFQFSSALLPFLGLLFIVIGFMFRKAKRNFFIGIRTPWTLSNDSVWDKTHQLGSKLFLFTGALAIAGSFFSGTIAFWLLFVPLIVSVFGLVIYSYVLYRNEAKA